MAVKVLVVHSNSETSRQVAQQIANGAKISGAEAGIADAEKAKSLDLAQYAMIFIGFHGTRFGLNAESLSFCRHAKLDSKPVAAFFTLGALSGKKPVELALKALEEKGAHAKNTLTLHLEGPLSFLGKGTLKPIDLIRAEAFGERSINYLTGTRVSKASEKHAIKGYKKQEQNAQTA